jgi:hypothetical protein
MPNYHLAQINIGRMLAPIDDPIMAEFVACRSSTHWRMRVPALCGGFNPKKVAPR